MNKINKINFLITDKINEMIKLWETSVRVSHDFLTENDIQNIKHFLPTAFKSMEHLLNIQDQQGLIKAFMGLVDKKIEMLFVHADFMGQGLGKLLIEEALQKYKINFVDVNEDNIKGLSFYQHLGFQVYSRTEIDDFGNPYPILHLKHKT